MEDAGGPFFARHQSLPDQERHVREHRTPLFQRAQRSLKRFDPFSENFTQQTLQFLQLNCINIRYMLQDTSIPLTDDGDNDLLDPNVSSGGLRALRLASIYLWTVVPAKVQFLRLDQIMPMNPSREELYQQVWIYEHELLEELRAWGKHFRKNERFHRFSPHSMCSSGWFKASAFGDCSDHMLTALRTGELWPAMPTIGTGDVYPDLVPTPVCAFSTTPDAVAIQHLVWSHCLADGTQFHINCAYGSLVNELDLDQAAAHLQVASLLAMLCDGCRADGQGFNPLPLDRLLWQFGILVSEALALKDVKLNEDLERYAWAARMVVSAPPRSAWRGSEPNGALLFGRPSCTKVLRPMLCIQNSIVTTGDFAGESELLTERLPTCHYERQKTTSVGLQLKAMKMEDAQEVIAGRPPHGCSLAPAETILLMIPVFPRALGHLTSEMIIFTGALAWFYGPTGKKLLKALWQSAAENHRSLGPPPEEGLFRNSTEVLLVPSPGRFIDPEKLLLKDLYSLLSSRPIRTLLGDGDCRCYGRAAVWGILEAPFSGPGDFTFPDSLAMRAAVVRHVTVTHGHVSPSQPAMPPLPRVLLVDRCKDALVACKRHIANLQDLTLALSSLEDVKFQTARLEDLPVLEQIRLILTTQVLVAAFGATLAWIPLLPKNSFVIEMHPGPPEALTTWGSCWTAPPGIFATAGSAAWDLNPRSEFGGWARTAHVHHACSSTPASINRRCLRSFRVAAFEIWSFEVDVEEIVALVKNAVERLSG